ncbi:type III secretion system translocon subunit SctE [Erwiniaceae bacterium BAC15a-03b]|uniref:Type III secretion system translocon subunit SctE n=1 Tax=Winslowiella arboricola TaxID=2978220 RepID=A0A9J6PML8_9GAMM|nr:type III secretion system translocon subunit SctE [Winslowiella arboricola]MCU5773757.1 type III secretion system translocon subunit SctE [Winslowiella arboricola]MCU5777667.1 type III secretion system translocon subunit SctE [Winslowiella arboricola]
MEAVRGIGSNIITAMPPGFKPEIHNRFTDKFRLTPGQALEIYARASEGEEINEMPALREVGENASKNKSREGETLYRLGLLKQPTAQDEPCTLNSLLSVVVAGADSRLKQTSELSAALERATAQLQTVLQTLEGASARLGKEKSAQEACEQRLAALQNALAALEQQGVTADDPRYSALTDKIVAAKNALNTAHAAVLGAEAGVLQQLTLAQELLTVHRELIKQMTTISTNSAGYVVMNRPQLEEADKKQLSMAAKVALLMAQMMNMFSDANLARLQSDKALNDALMEATRNSMAEKAKEFADQERKARETSEKCGIIAKVFGGALTALGALSVVFGGAGATLMVIGIGLLVADHVTEAAFGFSLTEKMMSPLMDHIFMPLMDAISNVVTDIFDKTPLGLILREIDKATGANMMSSIHTAVAAAATVAMIVAAAMVLKSAGKMLYKRFGKALAQAVVENVKGTINQAIKQMPKLLKKFGGSVKNLNTQLSKMMDDLANNILKKMHLSKSQSARILGLAGETIGFVDTAQRLSSGVIIADLNVKAHEYLADVQICKMVMDQLNKAIERMAELLESHNAFMKEMGDHISTLLQARNDTALSIIRMRKA